jgi:hypothetical protein
LYRKTRQDISPISLPYVQENYADLAAIAAFRFSTVAFSRSIAFYTAPDIIFGYYFSAKVKEQPEKK